MNIFVLSQNPIEAATWLVDKHIVKMPTESAQMLSTCHRLLDGEQHSVRWVDRNGFKCQRYMHTLEGELIEIIEKPTGPVPIYTHPRGYTPYEITHSVHPSNRWTMEGKHQYRWHWALAFAMCEEYTRRYGKVHAAQRIIELLKDPPKNIGRGAWTEPPQAMPEQYKGPDVVEAYRRFYTAEKAYFAKWKHGQKPPWFK